MRPPSSRLAAIGIAFTLGACGEDQGPPTMAPVGGDWDQVIFGLVFNLTADGVLRARLESDTAYIYEERQTTELFQVKVTFFNSVGEPTSTLTSDEGTYEMRSGDMQARGNVVGVSPDGRRLTTALLNYRKLADRLEGPEPFVFDAPDQHLEGSSFIANPDFTDVRATDVRGTPGQVEVSNP